MAGPEAGGEKQVLRQWQNFWGGWGTAVLCGVLAFWVADFYAVFRPIRDSFTVDDPEGWSIYGFVAALSFLAIRLFAVPHVRLSSTEVTVVNPLRTHHVPRALIAGVRAGGTHPTLQLKPAEDRSIRIWGLEYSNAELAMGGGSTGDGWLESLQSGSQQDGRASAPAPTRKYACRRRAQVLLRRLSGRAGPATPCWRC